MTGNNSKLHVSITSHDTAIAPFERKVRKLEEMVNGDTHSSYPANLSKLEFIKWKSDLHAVEALTTHTFYHKTQIENINLRKRAKEALKLLKALRAEPDKPTKSENQVNRLGAKLKTSDLKLVRAEQALVQCQIERDRLRDEVALLKQEVARSPRRTYKNVFPFPPDSKGRGGNGG